VSVTQPALVLPPDLAVVRACLSAAIAQASQVQRLLAHDEATAARIGWAVGVLEFEKKYLHETQGEDNGR
jgi:hypothetical protein